MNKETVFLQLGLAGLYIGLGLMAGNLLTNATDNNGYWIGGILVFVGAIALGVSIGSRSGKISNQQG